MWLQDVHVLKRWLVKIPVEDAQPSHSVDINIINYVKVLNFYNILWAYVVRNLQILGKQVEAVELKSSSSLISHHHLRL